MYHAVLRGTLAMTAILAGCVVIAVPARAGVILTVQTVAATPGSGGTLQVTLTNDSATDSIDVSAFNFLIDSTSTDINLDSADFSTILPYIFAGNSFDEDNLLSLNTTSGQSLAAIDGADNPPAFTVVAPGASFGLADVLFDVAPNAALGFRPITFDRDPANTSVSDENGMPITIDAFVDGGVIVSPEPSPVWLMLGGLPFLALRSRRRFYRTSL
jgi:hypothetical protein